MVNVSRRGGFSDRYGIKPENTDIQLYEFDQRTRVQLQNEISRLYVSIYADNCYYDDNGIQEFLKYVLRDIYSLAVNDRSLASEELVFSDINATIQKGTYDEVLTLVEAIVQYWEKYLRMKDPFRYKKNIIESEINSLFEREYIGYRFINNLITPISNSDEADSIKKALNTNVEAVRNHLNKASMHLSDRKKPDYENSIKESVLAVEALCEKTTGLKGKEATLGNMLKHMENVGIIIHPSLKEAFSKMYGYSSDAKGIRHAGNLDGPDATFEEARFMLVSCSAFINYVNSSLAKKIDFNILN